MSAATLSGVLLVILMIAFIGIVFWAYSRHSKRRFEEAAQLALDEDDRQIQFNEMEHRR